MPIRGQLNTKANINDLWNDANISEVPKSVRPPKNIYEANANNELKRTHIPRIVHPISDRASIHREGGFPSAKDVDKGCNKVHTKQLIVFELDINKTGSISELTSLFANGLPNIQDNNERLAVDSEELPILGRDRAAEQRVAVGVVLSGVDIGAQTLWRDREGCHQAV